MSNAKKQIKSTLDSIYSDIEEEFETNGFKNKEEFKNFVWEKLKKTTNEKYTKKIIEKIIGEGENSKVNNKDELFNNKEFKETLGEFLKNRNNKESEKLYNQLNDWGIIYEVKTTNKNSNLNSKAIKKMNYNNDIKKTINKYINQFSVKQQTYGVYTICEFYKNFGLNLSNTSIQDKTYKSQVIQNILFGITSPILYSYGYLSSSQEIIGGSEEYIAILDFLGILRYENKIGSFSSIKEDIDNITNLGEMGTKIKNSFYEIIGIEDDIDILKNKKNKSLINLDFSEAQEYENSIISKENELEQYKEDFENLLKNTKSEITSNNKNLNSLLKILRNKKQDEILKEFNKDGANFSILLGNKHNKDCKMKFEDLDEELKKRFMTNKVDLYEINKITDKIEGTEENEVRKMFNIFVHSIKG